MVELIIGEEGLFKNLPIGETFIHKGELYMKIEPIQIGLERISNLAIDLRGEHHQFPDNEKVYVVDVEMRI